MQHHTVPYGVCELNGKSELRKINEKPQVKYLVNTGLYLINNKMLSEKTNVQKNEYFVSDTPPHFLSTANMFLRTQIKKITLIVL